MLDTMETLPERAPNGFSCRAVRMDQASALGYRALSFSAFGRLPPILMSALFPPPRIGTTPPSTHSAFADTRSFSSMGATLHPDLASGYPVF